VSSVFGHRLYLDGPILDLWREVMRISFSTHLRSLWHARIVSIPWVQWLLRNHATFRERQVIFAKALLWFDDPSVRRIRYRLTRCKILLISSYIAETSGGWVLGPRTFWRSFDVHPSRLA